MKICPQCRMRFPDPGPDHCPFCRTRLPSNPLGAALLVVIAAIATAVAIYLLAP